MRGRGIEALVEPFHDEDLSSRKGYDERFLGVRVPMPKVIDRKIVSKLDSGAYRLPYEHFTVVMHRTRRLALFTASNVDAEPGARRSPSPGGTTPGRRSAACVHSDDREKWFTDPRIPATHQLPNAFFDKDRAVLRQGPHREARRRRVGQQLRRAAARERRHLPRDQLLAADRELQPLGLGRPLGRAREPRSQAGEDREVLALRGAGLPQERPSLFGCGRRRPDPRADSAAVLEDRRGENRRKSFRRSRSSSTRTSPTRSSSRSRRSSSPSTRPGASG